MYTIYLTTNCNFQCKYCYENFANREEISEEKLIETIDWIYQSDSSRKVSITFMGGEPLIKENLIKKAVEYIYDKYKERENVFFITTNASLLNSEIISFMEKYRFRVRVSLDGTEKTHNLNRYGKNGTTYYEIILDNIKKLLKSNCITSIRATIAKNTISNIFENVKFFTEIGIKDISMIPDINMSLLPKEKEIFEEQIALTRNFYLDKMKRGEKFGLDLFDGHYLHFLFAKNNRFEMCGAGTESFSIMPDGKIYPCGYVNDKEAFLLGEVGKGIDKNKGLNILYSIYEKEDSCSGCEIRFFCLGMKCGYLNYIKTRRINIPSQLTCFQEKVLYENVKQIFDELLILGKERISFFAPLLEYAEQRKIGLSEYGEKIKRIICE